MTSIVFTTNDDFYNDRVRLFANYRTFIDL